MNNLCTINYFKYINNVKNIMENSSEKKFYNALLKFVYLMKIKLIINNNQIFISFVI